MDGHVHCVGPERRRQHLQTHVYEPPVAEVVGTDFLLTTIYVLSALRQSWRRFRLFSLPSMSSAVHLTRLPSIKRIPGSKISNIP